MSMKKVLTKSSTGSTLELKAELLKWICERHATNEPLNRKLLREKAKELATSFSIMGFKCSDGWLTIFLKKYGFSPTLTSCDGPIFSDYRQWIDLLRPLLTQYRHKDLFNVDELVMYSNFFPPRKRVDIPFQRHVNDTFREISSITSQTKRNAILLCCNSSGTEKLDPLISDSCAKEKSLEDARKNQSQVICTTSDENFGIWLKKFNVRMSDSRRNVLLLLSRERIRSLNNLQRLSNVKLVLLPRDFPAHLRPLRGDVFHYVKMMYRRRYADFVHRREAATTACREWDRKEIVAGICEAWRSVPQEIIVSRFQRTKFREDESSLKIHCPEWDSFGTGMSFRKFVTFDDELCDEAYGRVNHELRHVSRANNRYNLRKGSRPNVELTNDVVEEKSGKMQTIVELSNREIMETHQDKIIDDRFPFSVREFASKDAQERSQDPIGDTPDNLEAIDTRFRAATGEMKHFYAEAGPSGNALPVTPEFGDSEKDRDGEELRLRILNAMEDCGDSEHRIQEIPARSTSSTLGRSKRSRSVMDVNENNFEDQSDANERIRKVARTDGDWSKRYETNFVFGPEINANEEPQEKNESRMCQTGNDEIEKRCIFTLEGSSDLTNATYSERKD